MKLHQLRYVLSVHLQGSFSAAAREHKVTQPTISNAISDLEEELGAKIFIRTTRHVSLSTFGERILPMVQRVLMAQEELQQEAKIFLNPVRPRLRLGFASVLHVPYLHKLVGLFQAQHPEIEIVYKECSVDDIETRLQSEEIDVGFGLRDDTRRQRQQQHCALYQEILRCIPSGDFVRPCFAVQLASLHEQNMVLTMGDCGLADATRRLLEHGSVTPRFYPGQALNYQTLQDWAQLGFGLAILPELKIKGDPTEYPVLYTQQTPASVRYEATWNADVRPAHVREFTKHLLRVAPTIFP